jgi:serpin B
MKYGTDLVGAMAALGAKDPFSPRDANFRKMFTATGDTNIFISEVLHKTYLKVDEQGSEAAAVTAIKMKMTTAIANPPQPFSMIVDRPFVCAIIDDSTGLVLFLGAITEPEV